MHNFKKRVAGALITTALACLPMVGLGQVLSGYTNSYPLANFDLNAESAFALYDEWQGLLSANLDVMPSARETEIYRALMRAEKGDGAVTSFSKDDDPWMAISVAQMVDKIKFCKELAWLVPTMHNNDKLLALRNPNEIICQVTGQPTIIWMDNTEGWLSPLGIGVCASSVTKLANWILAHPELYDQVAPTNAVIPLTIPGTTYYERAKFYLEEIKKTYEVCINSGMHWEFNTSDDGYAWIWTGETNALNQLTAIKAAFPAGVPVEELPAYNGDLVAYNRAFSYLTGYHQCAEGLQQIDAIEGTTVHQTFCAEAFDFVPKTMNAFAAWRTAYTEADPTGYNFVWRYVPKKYSENMAHFTMDLDFLEGIRHLLDTNTLHGIAGSIVSRSFDSETHLYFSNMEREYVTDGFGAVINGYWFQSPGYHGWVGEGGSQDQMQYAATTSLDVFNEQMRKMRADPDHMGSLLGRDDTRRTRVVKGPFELYDLKVERHARGLAPSPGMHAPVITSLAPAASFSIPESTPLGTVIGSVAATDADPGQTVRYWITGGNLENRFKINATNGQIRVNNFFALNDDFGSESTLEITVMDDGVPMQLATTNITISLINDKEPPVIPAGQTGFYTSNLLKGDPVMMVQASDPKDLIFSIRSTTDLFDIDPYTGVIRIKNSEAVAGKFQGDSEILTIGVTQIDPLPFTSLETVTITCEPSFATITASVSTGTVPFSVSFNSAHTQTGSIQSTRWDFGDGTTVNSTNPTHSYQSSGTHLVHALVMDSRGEFDRQNLQIVATGSGVILPPPGLLAHYSFSECSGTTAIDRSGNGNDATLSAEIYDMNGKIGPGFESRNRDYFLTVPPAVGAAISNEITLCFFAKGDPGLHYRNSVLYASNAAGTMLLNSHLPWGGASGTKYIWDAGNNGSYYDRALLSAPVPPVNEWMHWTFTKDAVTGSMAIYTNGTLFVSGSGNHLPMNGINHFQFGGNLYTGTLDEIRIYNKSLDAGAVSNLYAATPASQQHTLNYQAGINGSLSGIATQTVAYAESGSSVFAVAADGYAFTHWSDGRTDNPRIDLNVIDHINATAHFQVLTFEQIYVTWLGRYPALGATTNLTDHFDADGMNNLVEFALGGNPTTDDAAHYLPTYEFNHDQGSNYLHYIYRRSLNDIGVTYRVVSGSDLVNTSITNATEEAGVSGDLGDGFESVTNRVLIDTAPRQFIKLNLKKD